VAVLVMVLVMVLAAVSFARRAVVVAVAMEC
jgi:hypothetical protein